MIKLIIPERPVGKQSLRVVRDKKTGQMKYLPHFASMNFCKLVKTAALQRRDEILELAKKDSLGRIVIKWKAYLNHKTRADTDNISKAIRDGLADGVFSHLDKTIRDNAFRCYGEDIIVDPDRIKKNQDYIEIYIKQYEELVV